MGEMVDAPKTPGAEAAMSKVLSFLTSTGGAAFITVLLGGLLGQLISCDVQRRLKERDFNQAWLKARGDQALTSRTVFIETQRNAFEQIVTSAAEMTNASEELIYVMSPAFSLKNLRGPSRERVRAEQEKLTAAYRAADAKWAPARVRYDFHVAYYARGDVATLTAWRSTRSAVDKLRRCAGTSYSDWFLAGQSKVPYAYDPDVCRAETEAVTTAIEQLGKRFADKAEYGWEGWNDPAALRQTLESQ